jgi:5-bromo-4-chloroindolyl phosphate hydrolysis protein
MATVKVVVIVMVMVMVMATLKVMVMATVIMMIPDGQEVACGYYSGLLAARRGRWLSPSQG